MNRLRILNYSFLGLLLALMTSCNNEPDESKNTSPSTTREKDYYLKLGRKLENPYSVKNMRRALDSVKGKMKTSKFAKGADEFDIETSHVYVKIEPKNEVEEALLKSDTTQIFFDYPLDYEFPEEVSEQIGTNNKDSIGSYYVAVPKDYVFPEGIKKEVLEELYIPEQDPYFENMPETGKVNKASIKSKEDLLGNLLIAAYTLTHNEKQLGLESSKTSKIGWWVFGKKWRPNGRITMWDNSLNREVPVDGAQVLIRQWFTVDSGITNANGDFSTGTVRGEARYIIQWERQHYDIRNGWLGQAETRGPSENNRSWNYSVSGNDDRQYAMIHRAAHHYYYKDIKGLFRPPLISQLPSRMKISAMHSAADGINGDTSHWRQDLTAGILPMIRIYARNYCDEYYGTTIHELAHASHCSMGTWTYEATNDKVKESWARGVQWDLSRMVYPNYDADYPNLPNYTLVVRDLIDNDGYFEKRGNYGEFASGYTIAQLEKSLIGQKTFNDWKNKIKNDYENPTENNLDKVFDYWNTAQ